LFQTTGNTTLKWCLARKSIASAIDERLSMTRLSTLVSQTPRNSTGGETAFVGAGFLSEQENERRMKRER
jgi:hypothetical protein